MRKMTKLLGLMGLLAVGSVNAMTLSSPAFNAGGVIPVQYTCQGSDISPALQWSDIPPNAEAFALIVRDPDSSDKNFVHWVIYNMPLGTTSIPSNYTARMDGTLVGKNSWQKNIYQGPCPTTGTHHYRFELYALDQALYVNQGLTAAQLSAAMQGHILGMSTLTGLYTHH